MRLLDPLNSNSMDTIIKNVSTIIRYGHKKEIERLAKYMETTELGELFLYFPSKHDAFKENLTLGHQMNRFWSVRFEYNEGYIGPREYDSIMKDFLELDIQHGILEKLERQIALVNEIRKIYRAASDSSWRRTTKEYKLLGVLYFQPKVKAINPTISPFDAHCIVKEILLSKIKMFPSSTFPISVPLGTADGISRVIYKRGEDLTRDLFVLETIRYISRLINVELITYNVLALSRTEGLIEMVEGTDFTKIKDVCELRAHICLETTYTNPGLFDLKENAFLDSFCGYLVICYVIGIGDRNLGNMLITKTGSFLHVDFSYVFGDDPKFFSPRITIPKPICEYIKGDELVYSHFISRSAEIFLKVRRVYQKIFLFWSILSESRTFQVNIDRVVSFASNRLGLGEKEADAELHFVEEVKDAFGSYKTAAMHFLNSVGCFFRR